MRKSVRTRASLVGLAAALLALPIAVSTGGNSQASRADHELASFIVDGVGKASNPSEAQVRDIRQFASDSGKTEVEAMEESVGQIELSELAYQIETTHPDLFVGAGFLPDDPTVDAYFIFTEKPGTQVLEQIERLPIKVEVRYGAPWTQADLAAASEAVIEAAMLSPGVGSVLTSMDREAGAVVVRYAAEAGEEPDLEQLSRNVAMASAESTDGKSGPDVRLIRSDEVSQARYEVAVQGGRVLRKNGDPECTSGFSATRNGNQGLITANHCPDLLDYIGHNSAISFSAGGYSANTDMQFHRVTSGNSAEAKFQADSGDIRNVNSISNPLFAEQVCKYGNSTGYGCTSVYDTGLCLTNDQGTGSYCGLVVTNAYITSGGDSGGPWFYSFAAKGTHSGVVAYEGSNRSFFTQIGRAANQFNTTIMTN